MLTLATTVLMVTITVRAADQGERYLSVGRLRGFLIISGVVTALQAARFGRLGAGHVLMTGAGPHFIAVSVLALTEGGQSPCWRASSSCRRCFSSHWPPGSPCCAGSLRRSSPGTALMLIAASVIPVAVGRLTEVPEGTPPAAGIAVAAVTLAVAAALALARFRRVAAVGAAHRHRVGLRGRCILGHVRCAARDSQRPGLTSRMSRRGRAST